MGPGSAVLFGLSSEAVTAPAERAGPGAGHMLIPPRCPTVAYAIQAGTNGHAREHIIRHVCTCAHTRIPCIHSYLLTQMHRQLVLCASLHVQTHSHSLQTCTQQTCTDSRPAAQILPETSWLRSNTVFRVHPTGDTYMLVLLQATHHT